MSAQLSVVTKVRLASICQAPHNYPNSTSVCLISHDYLVTSGVCIIPQIHLDTSGVSLPHFLQLPRYYWCLPNSHLFGCSQSFYLWRGYKQFDFNFHSTEVQFTLFARTRFDVARAQECLLTSLCSKDMTRTQAIQPRHVARARSQNTVNTRHQ